MDLPEPDNRNIAAWPWPQPPEQPRRCSLLFEDGAAMLRALLLARGIPLPPLREQLQGWVPSEDFCWLAQALLGCPPVAPDLRWQLGRVLELRLEGRKVWLLGELTPLRQPVAASAHAPREPAPRHRCDC
jgi:hypothetical protein